MAVEPIPTMHPSGEIWTTLGHPVAPDRIALAMGSSGSNGCRLRDALGQFRQERPLRGQSAGRISRVELPPNNRTGPGVAANRGRISPILEGPDVTGISISFAGPNDRKGSNLAARSRSREWPESARSRRCQAFRRRSLHPSFCRPPSSCNANRWPVEFTAHVSERGLLLGLRRRSAVELARRDFRGCSAMSNESREPGRWLWHGKAPPPSRPKPALRVRQILGRILSAAGWAGWIALLTGLALVSVAVSVMPHRDRPVSADTPAIELSSAPSSTVAGPIVAHARSSSRRLNWIRWECHRRRPPKLRRAGQNRE